MSPTLEEYAQRIVAAALPTERISYGPWAGSMRSRSAEQVPRQYTSSQAGTETNYHYLPREGWWKRRKGQAQKFDTFGSSTGLLPAKWGAKCRQFEEFISDSVTDGIPTVCALLTKETIASGTDDGRFSTLYVRDQYGGVNYTLGDEFSTTTTYPSPGTAQNYKYVPLWYDSGDGGISRGITEFQRRLLLNGSRAMEKVGNWRYFPSVLGTPSRFRDYFTPSAALSQYARPSADGGLPAGWTLTGSSPSASMYQSLDDTGTDTAGVDIVQWDGGSGVTTPTWDFNNVGNVADPGVDTGFKIHLTMRTNMTVSTNCRFTFVFRNVGGATIFTDADHNFAGPAHVGPPFPPDGYITSSFAQYTISLSDAECALVDFTKQWRLQPTYSGAATNGANLWEFSQAEVVIGNQSTTASRLIPSGPIPPTHAGTLTKGNAVASSQTQSAIPDGDITTGAWTENFGGPTTLWECLTDSSANLDNDFIYAATNTVCEVSLGNLGFTPASDDTVTFNWRARRTGGVTTTLQVDLVENTTVRATQTAYAPSSSWNYVAVTLTAAQISAIMDWNDLRLRFTTASSAGIAQYVAVSWAQINFTPGGSALGGWHGSDRFPYAFAYRFEDDSIFAFSTPRFPNTILASGIGIFTVDSANPTTGYDKITWGNIPVPPYGFKSVLGLRGTKIDSTTEDNLAMDIHDMRIAFEVDAGVTSYDDYSADDDALVLDVDKLLIREDHIMPPRARWIFGGDSRVCHSYGGLNPAAITLAPVGVTTNYDLNLPDASSALYSNPSSYYRLASTGLTLVRDTGAATSTKTFLFSTYATLQDLCDGINKTLVSDTDWSDPTKASQWRAQVLPGVNPAAACATALCPTTRAITSVVTASNTTLTKAAGGLRAIPVGAFVTGTGITDGTYITAIVSDTQLTLSAVATASGTVTLTFVAGTGDSITGATHSQYEGYVRVIANSLPGFLYFNKTYLNQFPIEKDAVWMTVSNPESNKSAANCFSGGIANKHKPDRNVGISMGGYGVGNGFVAAFALSRGVIRNERDSGTGLDKDYHLRVPHNSGCCGPALKGNDCGFLFAPEGWIGKDLEQEIPISGAIWQHPQSDAVLGMGDFTYEAPLCVAAAGSDTDTAMLYARVMRGALWVNYRTSASTTHPNRQIKYDFSASNRSGLDALVRDQPVLDDEGQVKIPAGWLWGWSYPLSATDGRRFTQMCEGRRSDGSHLYGWNQENAGSTGDGRIDEFETGETDNGTAISASLKLPWESLASSDNIQAQEIVFEHNSPAGATVQGQFNRSFTGDPYTCTPDVSSSLVVSAYRWILSLSARVHSAACYVGFAQTAGTAGELRRIELKASRIKDLKAGTAG